jgi:hypothetical protein
LLDDGHSGTQQERADADDDQGEDAEDGEGQQFGFGDDHANSVDAHPPTPSERGEQSHAGGDT